MTLAAITRAAKAKTRAELAYREAVLRGAESHSASDIARAAGVSRQAVSQLLRRSRSH